MQVQIGAGSQAIPANVSASRERAVVFGEKCNALYEALLAVLKTKKDSEAILRFVSVTANFAEVFHPGRFADGSLENLLLEIGNKLDARRTSGAAVEPTPGTSDRRRVLHVATSVFNIGGHSRLIRNWIHADQSSEHSLVITDQDAREIPDWASHLAPRHELVSMGLINGASLLRKAKSLRTVANSGYDCVILHHHANDVVPVVAFAAAESPPVAVMNHADHTFWLGSSVADVVLDVRGFGGRISDTRRFAKKSLQLPIPLTVPSLSLSKAEARRRLSIPEDQIVLLSIGSAYKYTPTEAHNFFVTANKITAQNPTAHLYVIGIRPDQADSFSRHERIHYLGPIEDPTTYRLAADLYLDSFPYGSLIALLETAALGVCPVLMYSPPAPQYDLSEDVGFAGLAACTGSEDEYIDHVNNLIRQPQLRDEIAQRIKLSMHSTHSGERWRVYLDAVYAHLKSMQHRPDVIPTTESMQTVDDLALWEFKSVLYGGSSLMKRTVDTNYDLLSLEDMMRMFRISSANHDNNFTYLDQRHWLAMLGSKLLGRPGQV